MSNGKQIEIHSTHIKGEPRVYARLTATNGAIYLAFLKPGWSALEPHFDRVEKYKVNADGIEMHIWTVAADSAGTKDALTKFSSLHAADAKWQANAECFDRIAK